MKKIFCLMCLVVFASMTAFADIARPEKTPKPPKPRKSIEMNMSIHLQKDATEAVLRIPKTSIRELRAALDDLDPNPDTAAVTTTGTFSRTQTIVSGLFLSLALVFGGMWFAKSGKTASKTIKTLVILFVVAGLGSAATFIYANAGPPPEARVITGKMFSPSVHMYGFGNGKIRLETKDDEYGVDLIVPDPPDTPKTDE